MFCLRLKQEWKRGFFDFFKKCIRVQFMQVQSNIDCNSEVQDGNKQASKNGIFSMNILLDMKHAEMHAFSMKSFVYDGSIFKRANIQRITSNFQQYCYLHNCWLIFRKLNQLVAYNVQTTKFVHPIKASQPILLKYRLECTIGPLWAWEKMGLHGP